MVLSSDRLGVYLLFALIRDSKHFFSKISKFIIDVCKTHSYTLLTMSNESDDTTITFKLPTALQEQIKAAAEAEHRSVSSWLRFHLPEFFEKSAPTPDKAQR